MHHTVTLQNIGMIFQGRESETRAIEDVSFTVQAGEFVSIVGPSGCGKSTLLDIIAGLIQPTRGQVRVNGQVGYMLQRDHLLEWRTILGNCLLGPELQGADLKKARRNVQSLLKKYGLGDFTGHYPRQLSGGMRQRAALIRTLAIDPDVMLLDEPFSALDYQTRLQVTDEVWEILRQEHKTAILVTHDISEAISMSNRVLVLSSRPAYLKNSYNISLDPQCTPLERRKANDFRHYFNAIWKELDIDARTTGNIR